ncbi:MAG: EamA family transporter [Armatimonadetes bacterium]|nr:EamA family transporter [Armatimonadota bacterium]
MRYDLVAVAILCWGLAVFLPKMAGRELSAAGVVISNALGYLLCAPLVLKLLQPGDLKPRVEHAWGTLIGVLFVIGNLAYYRVLQEGAVSRLAPLTALYVAVPVVLGLLFLRERLSVPQAVGVLLAVVAVVLLAMGPDKQS